ncbi:erythropoietin [Emydura macquarii macquarii]|uniref:erythropoietin n=1 Tax=Emydura macquarii macquarii TaxID=1129001 RepID=UPI00352AB3CD
MGPSAPHVGGSRVRRAEERSGGGNAVGERLEKLHALDVRAAKFSHGAKLQPAASDAAPGPHEAACPPAASLSRPIHSERLFRRRLSPRQPVSQTSPPTPPGRCTSLLLLLGLAALTRPSPLRPVCDARVMEKFIKEAGDAEHAMGDCTNSCNFTEVLVVPDTKVNFNEWKKMDKQTQAAEVWGGQALLSAALLRARDLVPDPSLAQQLSRTYSNLRSVSQLLRSHDAQVEPDPPPAPPPTLGVRTLPKLLSIHSNFLRGRVKLFLTDACQTDAG